MSCSNFKLPSELPWTAEVDGQDLVVRSVTATCFGGRFDKGDNGQTESGMLNNGTNKTLQVALPIRSIEAATRSSPLAFKGPHIPWFTKVKVWFTDKGENSGVTGQLTDNGPNELKYPTHAIDLNPEFVISLDPPTAADSNLANTWSNHDVSFRVINGAKWIS